MESEDLPDSDEPAESRVTFALDPAGKWIKCLLCGRTSHHRVDVVKKYCSHCNMFHDEPVKESLAAKLDGMIKALPPAAAP